MIFAKHSGTETSSNNIYFGFNGSTTSGNYYSYVRDFMNNETRDRTYVADANTGEISQGSTDNRRFELYANNPMTGQIALTVYFSYEIKDI